MTEAFGVSALLGGTAAPQSPVPPAPAAAPSAPAPAPAYRPIGMPNTPASFNAPEAVAARARIEELKGDKEFWRQLQADGDRGVSGAARQEWQRLHSVGFPSPTAIESQADVDAQAKARAEQIWSGYFAALKERFPLTPENEAELRGGVIRADLHAWAREEKDRLIKDRGFRTKLLDGDRQANHQWGMITSMLSLRPVRS